MKKKKETHLIGQEMMVFPSATEKKRKRKKQELLGHRKVYLFIGDTDMQTFL